MLAELAAENVMLCFSIHISVACGVSLNFRMDIISNSNHKDSAKNQNQLIEKKKEVGGMKCTKTNKIAGKSICEILLFTFFLQRNWYMQ